MKPIYEELSSDNLNRG